MSGSLDDLVGRGRIGHAVQTEPGTLQEIAILLLGALPSAENDQHVEVGKRRKAGLVAFRQHGLDENDAPAGS